jgi:hypothetical protein
MYRLLNNRETESDRTITINKLHILHILNIFEFIKKLINDNNHFFFFP